MTLIAASSRCRLGFTSRYDLQVVVYQQLTLFIPLRKIEDDQRRADQVGDNPGDLGILISARKEFCAAAITVVIVAAKLSPEARCTLN
jgi:hypothetical protein